MKPVIIEDLILLSDLEKDIQGEVSVFIRINDAPNGFHDATLEAVCSICGEMVEQWQRIRGLTQVDEREAWSLYTTQKEIDHATSPEHAQNKILKTLANDT